MIDPDFDREAGLVMASPYFISPPPGLTGDALYRWWDERDAEKKALSAAFEKAETRKDLPPAAEAIYEKAYRAIVHAMDAQDAHDRVNGNGDF
jgi:hypothetical protein